MPGRMTAMTVFVFASAFRKYCLEYLVHENLAHGRKPFSNLLS